MTLISSGLESINKQVGKACNWSAKKLSKSLEQGIKDPARFAAQMLVTSIVTKDAIGCVIYTQQSLNNEKIPEDKRKFVAALDLMNGLLMVGGQLLVGFVIDRKLTPWLTSLYTGTIKNKDTGIEKNVDSVKATSRLLHPDNIKNVIKKINANISPADLESAMKKIDKSFRSPFVKGFGLLIGALATTALTKRTIVPLISTPLAGQFKSKFMDKKAPEQEDKTFHELVTVSSSRYDNKMDQATSRKTPLA